MANRECDPDLCKTCDAHLPPFNDPAKEAQRVCLNVKLQTSQKKPVFLGRSAIHGWGAYSKEPVEKNELVTEYLGEVISQEEADRRCVMLMVVRWS